MSLTVIATRSTRSIAPSGAARAVLASSTASTRPVAKIGA